MIGLKTPGLAALFHRVWTKAVGTPDYKKSEWVELEAKLFQLEITFPRPSDPSVSDVREKYRRIEAGIPDRRDVLTWSAVTRDIRALLIRIDELEGR